MVNKQLTGLKDFNIVLKDKNNNQVGHLPFVQALNFEFENTKKPIYNFSQEEFQSVAKGKRLVQGVMVLKQSHINYLQEKNKISTEKTSKALEERLTKYSDSTQSYLRGILKEITTTTTETKSTAPNKSILSKALALLEFEKYRIDLAPSNAKTGKIGFYLADVNFTKVRNIQDISEGSGAVYMEFFANWKLEA